jgi:hypothetical protein
MALGSAGHPPRNNGGSVMAWVKSGAGAPRSQRKSQTDLKNLFTIFSGNAAGPLTLWRRWHRGDFPGARVSGPPGHLRTS